MNWTVSRRIALGFTLGTVLVALMAWIGVYNIRDTSTEFRQALLSERDMLLRAVEARGNVRNANVFFLRYLLEGGDDHQAAIDEAVLETRVALEQMRDGSTGAESENWAEALRQLDDWNAATDRIAALYATNDTAQAFRLRATEAQPTRDRLESVIEQGVQNSLNRADQEIEAANMDAGNAERMVAIGAVATALLFMFVGYLLNRAIARPLQETSSVLATSATEILSTATEQAAGATESLAAVTETAATVDEVVQTAEQSAERARMVAASAQRAADIGREGRQAVEASVLAIEDVRKQSATIGDSIVSLAGQANSISEIIATVTDLADQTNMLALNAAIEAARAGEHGRGFAVVAGEVRNLAEQSKAGTARVRQILEQVQVATSGAVTATEIGNQKVNDVSRQVAEAGETIRQLADAVGSAAQAAAQIAASAGQQTTGMTQIKQAIGNIQQAAQQNLAATRQAEGAAQELNRLGSTLLDLVGRTDMGRP